MVCFSRSTGASETKLPVHDRQVSTPWAHGVAVLLSHHARGLYDVPEVVGHPRGEQLTERDAPELRMLSLETELRIGQAPSAERRQVVAAQARELVEEIRQ